METNHEITAAYIEEKFKVVINLFNYLIHDIQLTSNILDAGKGNLGKKLQMLILFRS